MLETPQENVKLLKAGIDGKTIEKLYIIYNNFKIASSSILFDLDKMQIHPSNIQNKKKMIFSGRLRCSCWLMLVVPFLLFCVVSSQTTLG
jgi:hypothetical protein